MKSVQYKLQHHTLCGMHWQNQGKPLVLALHGWLDNAASFKPLAPFMSDYQIIAIDLPGHGHSSHRSPDAHYHLLDFVQDLHELIEQQGWQDFILLGHSLGGIISSLYCATFRERVAALISIEAVGALTEDAVTSPEQLKKSVVSRIAVAHKTAKHPQSLQQAITARKAAGDLSSAASALLVERNLQGIEGSLSWRTDRRLRTQSSLRLTESQAKAFLQVIEAPMLVILGDAGFSKVAKNLANRQNWITDLSVATVDGGHHVHMDNPEPVARAITAFLQQKNCKFTEF